MALYGFNVIKQSAIVSTIAITFTATTWQIRNPKTRKNKSYWKKIKINPKTNKPNENREAAQDLRFIISFSAYFSLCLAVHFFLEQGF